MMKSKFPMLKKAFTHEAKESKSYEKKEEGSMKSKYKKGSKKADKY